MRREIQAPFTSHLFETTEAEQAGRGSLRLERGSGSFALSIQDDASSVVVWSVRVQAKMADAGAGLVHVGTVHTVPPSQGSPPHRIVAFLSVPGAVALFCEFFSAVAGARATVGFGECPYIGELGLVPSQWADRETDRYRVAGDVLPAGISTININPAGLLTRRVWAIGVFQSGVGGLVSEPFPLGMVVVPTIPIPPNGSINLHPGAGLLLPLGFTVNMQAGGGGYFIEWGE